MAKRILLTLLLCLGASPVQAQEAGERRVIPLGVHTEDGRVVGRLTKEQVKVKGVEADWELALDQGPRRIVLLLDMSESMHEKLQWQRALEFIRNFVALAAEEDEIALHIYAERHSVVVPFTREREPLLDALDSLPRPATRESRQAAGFYTQLKDALVLIAEEPLGFGGAIVLVADSFSDSSRTRDSRAKNLLASRAVRLLHVNTEQPGEVLRPAMITRHGTIGYAQSGIVEHSGGRTYYFWHSVVRVSGGSFTYQNRKPDAVARLVYLHTKYLYRLELRLKEPLVKKRKIRVLITDKEIKREYNPQLFYPTHLYPAISAD